MDHEDSVTGATTLELSLNTGKVFRQMRQSIEGLNINRNCPSPELMPATHFHSLHSQMETRLSNQCKVRHVYNMYCVPWN